MLDIQDLHIAFRDHLSDEEVVHGFTLHMDEGEIVGVVGESGSGKTQTALAVAGLLKRSAVSVSGHILLDGADLLAMSRAQLRRYQGKDISVIFQEPMTSLNPTMRIGPQVEESMRIHEPDFSPEERRRRALEAMGEAELPDPEDVYRRYPHELSGGMRQRVMIASAIVCRPRLLIADEPTTALDVTIQAQILKLLKKINRRQNVAILFISHALRVIRALCGRVAVMEKGRIVECGPTEQVFFHPQHPYTQKLIASIPARGQGRYRHEP